MICLQGTSGVGTYLVRWLPGQEFLPEEPSDQWDAHGDPVPLPDLARPRCTQVNQSSAWFQKVCTPRTLPPKMSTVLNFSLSQLIDVYNKKVMKSEKVMKLVKIYGMIVKQCFSHLMMIETYYLKKFSWQPFFDHQRNGLHLKSYYAS